ncbi:MAG: carbohydrate binding family 9 domain-containing protein [Saprospiraceae bacterium]
MQTHIITFLLLSFLISHPIFAQDADVFKPDSIKKEIHAVAITSSLHIDGVMDEAEWQWAPPSPQFTQVEPFQGESPTNTTEVRVLYNKQFLYFGIIAHDSLGKKAIRATDFKRDFNDRQHDLINLSFDGFNDKRNAMSLITNAYGVQRDLLAFDDLYYDIDWDGLWRVRTSRIETGWIAEIAIPWQTLRYPKTSDTIQNWGFNVMRNRRLTNELSAFSPYPRSFTSLRMEYAGILKNLQPPPPRPNIRIQPYFLTSYDRYKGYNNDVKPEETNYKFGGELKWAINPNTVLDLTANTDFAQADADRQVNNVTRFSVFFPERRQFFLENASLFGIGVSMAEDGSGGSMRIQPFFSRKIGLDDFGNPIPIDAGGRFVFRSSKRNFGAILMRQREVEGSPATNFFVGRFSENFGRQNRIGGLVTLRNQPNGTNITSTIDGFFRIGESHSINTMLTHSTSSATGKQGFAGIMQYYWSTNQYKIWFTQSLVTKDFNPDLGFVSRSDVLSFSPGMNWYYRGDKLPFKKMIRAFEPGFLPEFYYQASTGKLIERLYYFFPFWLNFQNGGYLGYSINPIFQHLTEPFEPLGVTISEGDYHYFQQQIWASTDPSKILNLRVIYTWGEYFDGKLNSGDWQLQFAPIPHFSLIGRFNRNRFKNVGITNAATTVDLYSIEGRFALNPRLQLIGFFQSNSENNSSNYNIRLSWEYQPLSYVYLVFNHRGFDTLQREKRTEDHVIAKLSYLKQF